MRSAVPGAASSTDAGAVNISGTQVPLWSWADPAALDESCRKQAQDLASLPGAVHVALMPDAHGGYGMPIGGVLATDNTVVPYAVGVDIGCGVVVARTRFTADDIRPRIDDILERMYETIPVGQPSEESAHQGSFRHGQGSAVLHEWLKDAKAGFPSGQDPRALYEKVDRQLGTMGGGNHFASLEHDQDGRVWLMLHSGSRAFGKNICDRYHALARAHCEKNSVALPNVELAFLELGTPAGDDYVREMRYGMRFAEENRARMFERMREALRVTMGGYDEDHYGETHHNYASPETHFSRQVIVHRKGAVKAFDAERGESLTVSIPGSMETGSYIGAGRACELALHSCSHGAGRALARKAATRALAGTDIVAEMRARGMVLRCPPGSKVLEEAGRAYKDVDNVMARQADLVAPLFRLTPIGTLKG